MKQFWSQSIAQVSAHLLVCSQPLNKVCRDLSRHHPDRDAGTLLHRHPDMILTSHCSFLFQHHPLSFSPSQFPISSLLAGASAKQIEVDWMTPRVKPSQAKQSEVDWMTV